MSRKPPDYIQPVPASPESRPTSERPPVLSLWSGHLPELIALGRITEYERLINTELKTGDVVSLAGEVDGKRADRLAQVIRVDKGRLGGVDILLELINQATPPSSSP